MTAPRTLVVRPERAADAAAIRAVHILAFAGDGHDGSSEAGIVDAIREDTAFIPELSVVADLSGTIVGHLVLSRGVIETATGAVPCLALGPVGVLPGYEAHHVGTRMMRHALAEAVRLGHRLAVVLGHPKYYRRVGFRPARPRGVTSRWDVPDDVFMVMELVPGALDGVSGQVRYPRAFDTV